MPAADYIAYDNTQYRIAAMFPCATPRKELDGLSAALNGMPHIRSGWYERQGIIHTRALWFEVADRAHKPDASRRFHATVNPALPYTATKTRLHVRRCNNCQGVQIDCSLAFLRWFMPKNPQAMEAEVEKALNCGHAASHLPPARPNQEVHAFLGFTTGVLSGKGIHMSMDGFSTTLMGVSRCTLCT